MQYSSIFLKPEEKNIPGDRVEKMSLSVRNAICFQQKSCCRGKRAEWSRGWCTGGFDYYHGEFIPNRHEPPGWNETALTRRFLKLVWSVCFVSWSWCRCLYSRPPTAVFGPSSTLNEYTVWRRVVVLVSLPVLKNTDSQPQHHHLLWWSMSALEHTLCWATQATSVSSRRELVAASNLNANRGCAACNGLSCFFKC